MTADTGNSPPFTPFGAGWRMLAGSLMAHFEIDPAGHPAEVRELGEIFEAETLGVGRRYLEECGLLKEDQLPPAS